MKFYHLLATKSASIFHQLVVSLNTPALLSSSLEIESSSTSDSQSDTTEPQVVTPPPVVPPCAGLVRSQSQSSLIRTKLKRISRGATDAYKGTSPVLFCFVCFSFLSWGVFFLGLYFINITFSLPINGK